MDDSSSKATPQSGLRTAAGQTLNLFASLKLAVALLVIIAALLAAATIIESIKGPEYAQWHFYKNPWFMALVGLMAINILAAVIVRFPWRWRHFGFLLAHIGVLVLLAGALLTYSAGIEGQLALVEGESGDSLLMPDVNRITMIRAENGKGIRSYYPFVPGPTDWPARTTLQLDASGPVKLKLLNYYRHAHIERRWIEDPSNAAGPAIQVALTSRDGTPMFQQWFSADPFAEEPFLGPIQLSFDRAATDSMLADFINPPTKDMGKDSAGVLSMHYEGRMYRIPVRENIGKKVPVGKSGISVEILSYLPDARPDSAAHFTTASQEPNNPLLELKIYVPGKDQPQRQIAFAKKPLLNLDGIHGWNSPGQVLVSPSGGVARSGRAIHADPRRQAPLPGYRRRQGRLARRRKTRRADSCHRPARRAGRQVPRSRPPRHRLLPGRGIGQR